MKLITAGQGFPTRGVIHIVTTTKTHKVAAELLGDEEHEAATVGIFTCTTNKCKVLRVQRRNDSTMK
jgi:hypothetical protein